MSNRFILLLLSLCSVVIISCKKKSPIVNAIDYEKYLLSATSKNLQEIDKELNFWRNKLALHPGDMAAQAKTAGLLTRRFSFSGNISEVHTADSLFRVVNRVNSTFSSATFRSLAANNITQHKFREAAILIDSAMAVGDNKYLSALMEIDLAMELGNVQRAKLTLATLKDKTDFGYLVRKAKMLDHEGKSGEAITIMNELLKNINPEFQQSNYGWAKTNLGDWLGHDNQFEAAYQSYLDALKVEPENYHALKGIAWLAFAHDGNTTAAKNILHYLLKVHRVPDYKLMLGEIAAFENNMAEKNKWYRAFIADAGNPLYGDMYNKYIFSLQSDEFSNYTAAFILAEKEVHNRPTALSYDMLAYALYKSGDTEKANTIARKYVKNKCFEPFSIYHQAMIYKANGENQQAGEYLEKAYESAYELGPIKAAAIKKLLASL